MIIKSKAVLKLVFLSAFLFCILSLCGCNFIRHTTDSTETMDVSHGGGTDSGAVSTNSDANRAEPTEAPVEPEVTEAPLDEVTQWIVDAGVDPAAEEADFSNVDLNGVDMDAVIAKMPNLKKATLLNCGLTNDGYAAISDAHPDIKFVWEIVLSHWTVRTDAVAFGTFKTTADSFFMHDDEAYYLRYCTDLVALDIGHNYVSDLSFLEYMPNLKILILVDNVKAIVDNKAKHLTDLSAVANCTKLRYLEFFANNVSDLSFLDGLTELEDLNISYNSMSSITHLKNLPNLQRLWMEHTYISAADVQTLRNLYPSAKIVSVGEGSIDQGWRTGDHYEAMRRMLKDNVIDEIYMD